MDVVDIAKDVVVAAVFVAVAYAALFTLPVRGGIRSVIEMLNNRLKTYLEVVRAPKIRKGVLIAVLPALCVIGIGMVAKHQKDKETT